MGTGTAVRAVVATVVLAAVAAYAGPRVLALTRVPRTLDGSVEAAGRYNPGLEEVARLQRATLDNLASVDGISASLRGVLSRLGGAGGDLTTAVTAVQRDLAAALDPTAPALGRLVASLTDLEAKTRAIGPPLASSAGEIATARDALVRIQAESTALAASVHDGRVATDGVATNVFGRP